MIRSRAAVSRVLLVWAVLAYAAIDPPKAAAEDGFLSPYVKTILENGLTILVKEDRSAPIAAVDIRVGAGAVDEDPREAGISHFVEHMLFKGTGRRGVGEIAREIKAVGGLLNASTGMDATNYYVTLPSEYLDLALEVEADAIRYSAFGAEEIDRERDVLIEELRMYEDRPFAVMENGAMMAALFAGTPYATNVLGSRESLNRIRREDLVAYYRGRYVPDNMVIAVAGDVDAARIIARISEMFGSMARGEIRAAPAGAVPRLETITRIEMEKPVSQSYLSFAFPVPPLPSADGPALSLACVLLGGCKSARLNDLYGERLVQRVSAEYVHFRDVGMIGLYAETQNPSSVERRIRSILTRVRDQGVTDEEVSLAKAVIYGSFAANMERALAQATFMSSFEINGSVDDGEDFLKRIRAVTKEDVRRVMREYVHPERYVVLTLGPEEAP